MDMPSGVYERFEDPEEAAQARRDRKVRAYVFIRRGYTYDEVARKMGHSRSHIQELVKEVIDAIEIPPEADAIKMALRRYEAVLVELNRAMKRASPREVPALAGKVHENIRNQMALLGYAKPTKLQLVTEDDRDDVNAEYAELIALERARQISDEQDQENARTRKY